MIKKLQEISRLIDETERIINSTADWDVKYTLVFGLKITDLISETGINFDYYIPDTSYEEDIKAFYKALVEFRTKLGDVIIMSNK